MTSYLQVPDNMMLLRASSTGSTPRSSLTSDGGLAQMHLSDNYEVLGQLGEGTYGRCIVARCKLTKRNVTLKLLNKATTNFRDFLREFRYSRLLSAHPAVNDTYEVAFETTDHYVFAQDYAQLGDLFEFIPPRKGLQEVEVKRVARQLADGLLFLHSHRLVHRDVKPENVLVVKSDLSQVKLCDFGMTRCQNVLVRKTFTSIPYTPPEIVQAVRNEPFKVEFSADVWALAVLLFCCLTGVFPWAVASPDDQHWDEFSLWQRRKVQRIPSQFRQFTPRFLRCLRRLMEPCPEKRSDLKEIFKYLDNDWILLTNTINQEQKLCESESTTIMSLFNNGARFDKSRTATVRDDDVQSENVLSQCGVRTRVNRRCRELRVSEWLRTLSASPPAGLPPSPNHVIIKINDVVA